MKGLLILCLACLVVLATASEYFVHDYDIQIHPTHGHGHYGYDDHGFATSIRYDKRYHHKIPDYGHHDDVVYQYVSDGHHEELDDIHY